MTVRVLVCDDSELLRTALRLLLETDPDIRVVDTAADGDAAVDLTVRLRPDVVVLDIRMPGADGLSATRRIRDGVPGTRVLLLTSYPAEEDVIIGLRAGAAGFLLKDGTSARLLDAVHAIAAGQTVLDPAVTGDLLHRRLLQAEEPNPLGLSDRERELLALVGRGMSNAEIAAGLFLADSTVKNYVSRLFTRIDVRDRAQAIVLAHRLGLVGEGRAPE